MGVGSSSRENNVLPLYKKQNKPPPLSSLLSTIASSSAVLPLAQQGWCGFHKIDRNFTSNSEYKGILDSERDKSILGRVEIDGIVRWMWYFIKHYRTMEEVEMSAYLFNWYMTENDQSQHMTSLADTSRTKIMDFMCKSFFPHSDMLFESCFDGMTLEKVTTSICESWHRATKRVSGGPKPNHDIGESAKRINKLTEKKQIAKAKKAAYNVTSIPSKAEDREKYSRELTDYCNRKLLKEKEMASYYETYRESEMVWFVKRNFKMHPPSVEEDLGKAINYCQSLLDVMTNELADTSDPIEKKTIKLLKEKLFGVKKGNIPEYKKIVSEAVKYIVPRYETTHVLKIETTQEGDRVLTCGNDVHGTPCRFIKHGQACRHMYNLLERNICSLDATIRWHSSYAHFYGRDDEMTKHFIYLRDKQKLPGIPLTDPDVRHICDILPVGSGTKSRPYFANSLGKLRLSGTDTYWHLIRDRLPPHIQSCIPTEDDHLNNNEWSDENEGTADSDLIVEDGKVTVCIGGPTETLVHQNSEYLVPSQMTVDDQIGDTDPVNAQGSDAKSDFMPIYETLCKLTNSAGPAGHSVLEEQLNDIRSKQMMIIAKNKNPPLGNDAYRDFMPLFDSVCSLTNEAGQAGRQALRDGLNQLKKKQVDITTMGKSPSGTGVVSMPATSTKKVDKIIQSVCSPQKKVDAKN